MWEIKRIIKKKYLLIIITLFAVNILLFQYFQLDNILMLNDPAYNDGLLTTWKQEREEKNREFYERLDNIEKQKDSMLGISIFSNENSFAYKNIISTQKDYEKLRKVRIENINDRAVIAFLEYDEIYIIGFIIMLFTILSFFDERKKGLWQLIYSLRNGRVKLVLKRIGILVSVAFLTSFLLISETLAVSFFDYGGENILKASVQSVTELQNLIMTVQVYEFFIYYILIYFVTLFISGAFVWGMLGMVHNLNVGMIICIFVYGIEYYIYNVLSPQDPLCIFKYTNMFFIICPRQIFTEYQNFSVFGMLFNLREYFVTIIMVLMCIITMWVIVVGGGIHKTIVCSRNN